MVDPMSLIQLFMHAQSIAVDYIIVTMHDRVGIHPWLPCTCHFYNHLYANYILLYRWNQGHC